MTKENPKEENTMTKQELADSLTSNVFANRETIKEAYEYGSSIARACGKNNELYVLTALHVLMNTIASEILNIEVDAP